MCSTANKEKPPNEKSEFLEKSEFIPCHSVVISVSFRVIPWHYSWFISSPHGQENILTYCGQDGILTYCGQDTILTYCGQDAILTYSCVNPFQRKSSKLICNQYHRTKPTNPSKSIAFHVIILKYPNLFTFTFHLRLSYHYTSKDQVIMEEKNEV